MPCADAIGFHAAAVLEDYEEQLAALCRKGLAAGSAGRVQQELTRLCLCCLPLPQLSGAVLSLMLWHHRLLADLWRSGGDASEAAAARSLRCVQQCVHLLKARCRELFIARHLH